MEGSPSRFLQEATRRDCVMHMYMRKQRTRVEHGMPAARRSVCTKACRGTYLGYLDVWQHHIEMCIQLAAKKLR